MVEHRIKNTIFRPLDKGTPLTSVTIVVMLCLSVYGSIGFIFCPWIWPLFGMIEATFTFTVKIQNLGSTCSLFCLCFHLAGISGNFLLVDPTQRCSYKNTIKKSWNSMERNGTTTSIHVPASNYKATHEFFFRAATRTILSLCNNRDSGTVYNHYTCHVCVERTSQLGGCAQVGDALPQNLLLHWANWSPTLQASSGLGIGGWSRSNSNQIRVEKVVANFSRSSEWTKLHHVGVHCL